MPVGQPKRIELAEWESKRPQISDQIAKALGLVSDPPADVERLHSLYRRCLSYVSGFRGEEKQFDNFHNYVLAAIPIIQQKWPDVKPKDLREELERSAALEVGLFDQAINVAVCLWLGLDCVGQQYERPKSWPEEDIIHDFVLERSFDDPTEASIGDAIARFPPKFRAARLKDISGITIESTWYLDQHLRFNEYTRTLRVFMDVAWLQSMCKLFREKRGSPRRENKEASDHNKSLHDPPPSDESKFPSSPVQKHLQQTTPNGQSSEGDEHATSPASKSSTSKTPKVGGISQAAQDLLPLFEETLRTLDILFPAWDPKTINFVAALSDKDTMVSSSVLDDLYPQRQQSLTKFRFWRARLTELIVEHQSPPRDLLQIWKDRRNPMAFWTFWIGVMIFLFTLMFGVVASVLTGLAYGQAKSPALPMPPG